MFINDDFMNVLFRTLSLIVLIIGNIANNALADVSFSKFGSADLLSDLLPAEQAFVVFATVDSDHITIHWRIAKGYYLYKGKMRLSVMIESEPVSANQVLNGQAFSESVYLIEWPSGIMKEDPHFGWQEVFYGDIQIGIKITPPARATQVRQLRIDYQGCAEMGFCYPPLSTVIAPYGTVD